MLIAKDNEYTIRMFYIVEYMIIRYNHMNRIR